MMMVFKDLLNQAPGDLQCDTCSCLLHTLLSYPTGSLSSPRVHPVHIYLCLLPPVDRSRSICGPFTSVLSPMPPVPYSFVDTGRMPAKCPVTGWPWETLGADGHRPFLCGIHRLVREIVCFVKSQGSECWGPISHVLSVKGVSSSFVEESSHTGQKQTDTECASSSGGSLWLKSRQETGVIPFGHGLLTHLRILASDVEVTLLPNYVGLLMGPYYFSVFQFLHLENGNDKTPIKIS